MLSSLPDTNIYFSFLATLSKKNVYILVATRMFMGSFPSPALLRSMRSGFSALQSTRGSPRGLPIAKPAEGLLSSLHMSSRQHKCPFPLTSWVSPLRLCHVCVSQRPATHMQMTWCVYFQPRSLLSIPNPWLQWLSSSISSELFSKAPQTHFVQTQTHALTVPAQVLF